MGSTDTTERLTTDLFRGQPRNIPRDGVIYEVGLPGMGSAARPIYVDWLDPATDMEKDEPKDIWDKLVTQRTSGPIIPVFAITADGGLTEIGLNRYEMLYIIKHDL